MIILLRARKYNCAVTRQLIALGSAAHLSAIHHNFYHPGTHIVTFRLSELVLDITISGDCSVSWLITAVSSFLRYCDYS